MKQRNPSQQARRRRVAAERKARLARILVCDCDTGAPRPICDDLQALGYEFVAHHTLSDCLREATESAFDVVVASVPSLPEAKLKLLQLLRRAIGAAPLVLVTSDGSLAMRSQCQAARPFYYAVRPLEQAELRDVLRGALARVKPRTDSHATGARH